MKVTCEISHSDYERIGTGTIYMKAMNAAERAGISFSEVREVLFVFHRAYVPDVILDDIFRLTRDGKKVEMTHKGQDPD